MNWHFWKRSQADKRETKPKSKAREWWDAILFAVIAATLIRWLIMEAYTIPTPSMENSLLVGDFLFVSKFHYGTRTTTTPLQIPLTHQKIWFTEIPSYTTVVQLPQYRFPGISKVKNQDVVVFNVPPRNLNDREYPVDLKTNYIKRCVAIPGDILTIRDQEVQINGVAAPHPPDMQFSYLLAANGPINERNFRRMGLGPEDYNQLQSNDGKSWWYRIYMKEEAYQDLVKSKPSYITSINRENRDEHDVFPYSGYYNAFGFKRKQGLTWSQDNFGPLWVPKKGETIQINDSTLTLYGHTIVSYDLNEDVKIDKGKLYLDGKEVSQYTFNQNYYFMMGDNRHNSLDSRYWGFVPEDHIVGKAFFIWLSIDRNADFLNQIRWSRFFKLIE